jgi:hypothetical protein
VTRAALAMTLAAVLLVAGAASTARAEDDDPTAWHASITPYVWATGIYGDVTVRGRSAELDATFIDILKDADNLIGLQGHLEVTRGRWGVYGDLSYVKAKVEDAGPTGLDVTSRMWFIDFGAQYRILDTTTDRVPGLTLDVYGGGRYSFLEVGLDTRGVPSLNRDVEWIDPIVGGRLGVHFSEHVFLLFVGDVGGFGVGSDFAWSITGLFGYRWQAVGLEWAVLAGYKALAQDYSTGSGTGRFRWDTTMHGPILGLNVRF